MTRSDDGKVTSRSDEQLKKLWSPTSSMALGNTTSVRREQRAKAERATDLTGMRAPEGAGTVSGTMSRPAVSVLMAG
jgi:hypothetical protein